MHYLRVFWVPLWLKETLMARCTPSQNPMHPNSPVLCNIFNFLFYYRIKLQLSIFCKDLDHLSWPLMHGSLPALSHTCLNPTSTLLHTSTAGFYISVVFIMDNIFLCFFFIGSPSPMLGVILLNPLLGLPLSLKLSYPVTLYFSMFSWFSNWSPFWYIHSLHHPQHSSLCLPFHMTKPLKQAVSFSFCITF